MAAIGRVGPARKTGVLFTVRPVITYNSTTFAATSGKLAGGSILSRQWFRAGVAIPGATGLTYTKTAPDIGQPITFRQSATGGVVGISNAITG